uniref:Bulb-type lectin domain-containing protein n=1 Tax=Periophthalmus magnuspinnatus TaxID=409849 RepID=A0A3B4AKJ5_9GOBI
MNKKCITTGQALYKGDYLLSSNGNYKAVLQVRGLQSIFHLRWQLCSVQWAPIWATKTDGKDSDHVILQSDRNLVIYTKDKVPLWASKTDIQTSRTCLNLYLMMDKPGPELNLI